MMTLSDLEWLRPMDQISPIDPHTYVGSVLPTATKMGAYGNPYWEWACFWGTKRAP